LPWAKNSYDRIHTLYSSVIPKIGEVKFQNKEIPEVEMLIRAEVLRRDFTKRQMKIISMILTLSFYIGKKRAIIPKMQDWEICGINKIKARAELTQLVELNVIEWDEEKNIFSIIDPREWKVKFHSGYNDERAKDLFILNLKDSGVYSEE
jgi:hypothetical protein